MDVFIDCETVEPECNTTANIDFQMNKWESNELFTRRQIPENAFFTSRCFLDKLRNLYLANLDIPLLIYGLPGCGKITTLIGMISQCPAYFPSISDINDNRKMNNLDYMKIMDNEYPKIFIYENLYFLNMAVLNNNTEITNYLKQIYKIAKSRSIDASRKIFIISHIDICSSDAQRYITFMLDKINSTTSYIFTTTKPNQLDKKIRAFCTRLGFQYPNQTEFENTFKNNYGNVLDKRYISLPYLKKYWEIYCNNKYNIGNTLAQVKYLLSINDISLVKLNLDDNSKSLLDNIVNNFIKKRLKLTGICGAMDIRRYIYTLISVNIDLCEFIKCLVKKLISSKLNNKTKSLILEKAGLISAEFQIINKELISLETFLYNLIYIIYSGGEDIL